jgi:glycerate kinase
MGIDVVLDTVDFDRLLCDADLVLTGEGKLDSQSLQGKVVVGVAKRAKAKGVPVIAVVGGAQGDLEPLYALGVSAVHPINRMPEDFSVSRYKSEENLRASADDLLRILKL